MIDHLSTSNYCSAFVRDPDGNRIEAVTRRPEE
jgi:catechol 2,3-dioxygenase-like lactoylglutathione lyase family enzyme